MDPYRTYAAEQLHNQFIAFCESSRGVASCDRRECPHFLAFLDFVVERPVVVRNGLVRERPIRTSLVERVTDLRERLRSTGDPLQLSDVSISHARTLSHRYGGPPKRATPALRRDVEQVARALSEDAPRELRLRTGILLIWNSWARPAEILTRKYPDDIDADGAGGLVICVPRSKTNIGTYPEHFFIPHHTDQQLCAVCSLRSWVDWLGSNYRGPLFPGMTKGNRLLPRPLTTASFSRSLHMAFAQSNRSVLNYTGYSLRRGPATESAARGASLEEIAKRLRHKSILQTIDYIDTTVLFELVGGALA